MRFILREIIECALQETDQTAREGLLQRALSILNEHASVTELGHVEPDRYSGYRSKPPLSGERRWARHSSSTS